MLIKLNNQQDVFLGLINIVLLCLAFEYSDIGVDLILLFLRATSGFINKFKLNFS